MKYLIKKTTYLCIISIIYGLYRYYFFNMPSLLDSIIGGIPISPIKGVISYSELTNWLFIISFFTLLSVYESHSREKIYYFEVTRLYTIVHWWKRQYMFICAHTLANISICCMFWSLMDIIFLNNRNFPFLLFFTFALHLLCLISVVCSLSIITMHNEFYLLPIVIDSFSIFLSDTLNLPQFFFCGTWGMYKRHPIHNGGSLLYIIIFELLLIIFIYFFTGHLLSIAKRR